MENKIKIKNSIKLGLAAAAAIFTILSHMDGNMIAGEILRSLNEFEGSIRSENRYEKTESDNSGEGSRSENSTDSENKREEHRLCMTVSSDLVKYTRGKVRAYIDIEGSEDSYIEIYEKLRNGEVRKLDVKTLNMTYGLADKANAKRLEVEFSENGTYTVNAADKWNNSASGEIEIRSILKREKMRATDDLHYRADFSPKDLKVLDLPSIKPLEPSENKALSNKNPQSEKDILERGEKLLFKVGGKNGQMSRLIGNETFAETEGNSLGSFDLILDTETERAGNDSEEIEGKRETDSERDIYDILSDRLIRADVKDKNTRLGVGIVIFLTLSAVMTLCLIFSPTDN